MEDPVDTKGQEPSTSPKMVPSTDDEGKKDDSPPDIIILDEDHEDEDVPGDFFDDFLNEDFMAALDILDDDQWENQKNKAPESDQNKAKPREHTDKNVAKPKRVGDTSKTDKKTQSKSSDLKRVASNSRIRCEGDSSSKTAITRGKNSKVSTEKASERRDPQKTRKAIELDKSKCERDKENKIISEKLQLVETGLVPPGMEMETDLEKIKQQKEFLKSKSSRSESHEDATLNTRSRIPNLKNMSTSSRPPPKIRRSPYTRRPISRSRLSRSPYRTISPRRSPRRTSRSPRRSRERNSRRSRSSSPLRRRSRYSPIYQRDFHSRSRRDRSESPESRRRRLEKKSFLQEIVEKLREPTRLHPSAPMPHVPPMNQPYMETPALMSMPVPVPPPVLSLPNVPTSQPVFPLNPGLAPYDPYDQSYFIGNSPAIPTPHNISYDMPQNVMVPRNDMNDSLMMPQSQQPESQQPQQPHPESLQPVPPGQPEPVIAPQEINSQEQINQLFHDKTISLSEFLTITANVDASSTTSAELKEKIQIIRRCQEGMNILSSSEKPPFTGVLHLQRKTDVPPPDFVSPMIRHCQIKIPFTDSTRRAKGLDKFFDFVEQVVKIPDQEEPVPVEPPEANAGNVPIPPPPPQISTSCDTSSLSLSTTTQGVQTDQIHCPDCERRKNIMNRSIGTQFFHDKLTFSVSTQVTENDLEPKSESLASLTPAQLLSKPYSKPAPKKFDEYEQYRNARSGASRAVDYHSPPRSFERTPEKQYPGYTWPREDAKFTNYAPWDEQYPEFTRGRPPAGSPALPSKNRFKFF